MGNHRFRLSDMMPNAWFYKLRDMTKTRSQNPSHPTKNKQPPKSRKSVYQSPESTRPDRLYPSPKNHKSYDTHFPLEPPRRSSKKRGRRRTIYMPSPTQTRPPLSGDYNALHEPGGHVWAKPGKLHLQDCFQDDVLTSPDDHDFLSSALSGFHDSDSFHKPAPGELSLSLSSPESCKLSSSATDIIIDVEETSYGTFKINSIAEFNVISEPKLPPILTKPRKRNSTDKRRRSRRTEPSPGPRKSVSRAGGVRIRGNGPKLAGKKMEGRGRKSVKGGRKEMLYGHSFAIAKASTDPERDFRESMVEMIVENNIRVSKDLEDLLACYLSLNSNQYHAQIIKAFEQIWFNMPQPQF